MNTCGVPKQPWPAETAVEAIRQLRQDRVCFLPDGRSLLVAELTAREREALIDFLTAYARDFQVSYIIDAAQRLRAGESDVDIFGIEGNGEHPERWLETTPLLRRLRRDQATDQLSRGGSS